MEGHVEVYGHSAQFPIHGVYYLWSSIMHFFLLGVICKFAQFINRAAHFMGW